jgi:hypothetical protein
MFEAGMFIFTGHQLMTDKLLNVEFPYNIYNHSGGSEAGRHTHTHSIQKPTSLYSGS